MENQLRYLKLNVAYDRVTPYCEKLGIVNIRFADDVILFTIGDLISVQMIMKNFETFSKSKSLVANKAKCKVFFGGEKKISSGRNYEKYRV